ncbi:hypothetical protein TNCV_3168091, partial [Trichonephila clavipes]
INYEEIIPEFRDRKFDVGDRVAVRVYRAATTRWKFGTIVKPGWRTPTTSLRCFKEPSRDGQALGSRRSVQWG